MGKGEQGVLICEPYKVMSDTIGGFRTKTIAEKSSQLIFDLFEQYLDNGNFVGADMARKYLQICYTRARRYANYRGCEKYDATHDYAVLERGTGEHEKRKQTVYFFDFGKPQKQTENTPP
ncbi:DUF4385 domain-containing protein [Mucilaginibacter sp. SMC90]|uniref:DUF4385 family protein n=1 Tax=Mucilaginibacter sp. SMC90 TaxID=2929803 RepID=UPI001FB4AB03|nr:DUF4385 family protein [Mucilaginibacter sp. SMC90]UOE50974.1 DUF4385 domain-containing protein [Mucilaginibacter sp. SMC90]